jgi:hypothetical protein
VKKGSAGLGGAVLTAGGAVLGGYLGGPAGASAGASLGGSLASEWSGGAPDNYSGMVNAGVNAYNAPSNYNSTGMYRGGYSTASRNSFNAPTKGYGDGGSGGEFGSANNPYNMTFDEPDAWHSSQNSGGEFGRQQQLSQAQWVALQAYKRG